MELTIIQQKIYEIRGQKVMLDFDIANLYEVETKRLNEQVKRNIGRFPNDFMFRLTIGEWTAVQSQIVALSDNATMRSQIATASQKKRNISATPYAFNEHGITMLASILHSERAIKMSIAVVRAFIALKKFALDYSELLDQIQDLKQRTGEHDAQLNQIYNAIETLLDEKMEQKAWRNREKIGFKK
jgi:hypothetical protein